MCKSSPPPQPPVQPAPYPWAEVKTTHVPPSQNQTAQTETQDKGPASRTSSTVGAGASGANLNNLGM